MSRSGVVFLLLILDMTRLRVSADMISPTCEPGSTPFRGAQERCPGFFLAAPVFVAIGVARSQ